MDTSTNHYQWLDVNLPIFFKNLGVDCDHCRGLISAHGDKCYSYKWEFEENNIHFFHGVAIYLLTYVNPYAKEVREVDGGWVKPIDWIIANKNKFMAYLPPV